MRCINVFGGLYVTAEGRAIAGAAAQPRRLAVLALLAVVGDRGMSRERIVTCLWPDYDEERGRHALTQGLYALRRDLAAEDLFLGQQELRLNPDLITSDYAEFHAALRRDDPEGAVGCYRGPFLQDFHLPRAENFAHWVEEQRDSLGHEYGRALEAAARRAAERQDSSAAVGFLKRRAAQDPLNAKVAVKLMEALAAQGAVLEALQHARIYETVVKQELDLPPDPEVTALAERLRRAPRTAGAIPPPVEPQPTTEAPLQPAERRESTPEERVSSGWARLAAPAARGAVLPASSTRTRRWPFPAVISAVALAALGLVVALSHRHPPALAERGRSVVAVGVIADYSGGEPGKLGRPLADMLATNLARSSGFRVISNGRMLELMRQLGGASDSTEVVGAAARQAGAAELIDGALYAIAPNRFRLDLRRVDLSNGAVIGAYRVEGGNLFALVDSGTVGLVRDLGGEAPPGSLTEATTLSVKAYQAYEEGLRKYYEGGDRSSAERLFGQALDLDPEFAQAAFYYGLSTSSGSRTETLDRLRRALDLSGHAGDRDRLIIRAEWAYQNSSPALAALAETLMVRYPEELDGYRYAGDGAILFGNYLQADLPFRRMLALDSLNLDNTPGQRCWVCDAYRGLITASFALDSQARAHALTREWARRQPSSAEAWRMMANFYNAEGHEDSGLAALRVADSLEPTNPVNRLVLISFREMDEDYAKAEALLRAEVEAAPMAYRAQAKWDLANLLRQVGRLREALPLARQFRLEIKERLLPGAAPYNALLEGQILFESGDYRAAAALFDSIAAGQEGRMDPSLRSRDRIWAWVHEADALAQPGDTARLRFLADSMEVLGRNVAHARDRVLHAHVRGLIARLQRRDAEAAEWFRRAIVSPVIGFTRSNYELAGAYLRTHRPRDAVGILQPALRSFPDGSTLYVTRTDVEARLAEAFDSAGQADSALLYFRKVSRAWEHADPQFGPRRDSVQVAVRRLEAGSR